MILTKTTILVIEDDDAVRQTLIDMLELNGFRTLVATNGLSGLQLAQREAPSLIVTDVAMPGMTGFELLEQLRRDEGLRAIPVIVISAQRERAATRRGMNSGPRISSANRSRRPSSCTPSPRGWRKRRWWTNSMPSPTRWRTI